MEDTKEVTGETNPRRYKIAYIDQQEMLSILRWRCEPEDGWLWVSGEDIPEDAKVINIFTVPDRCALAVVLEHESFDPVCPGCIAPDFGLATIKKRLVKKK